ncbi:hypothetical protein IBL26_09815 [Roseomonas aerophila]|uniref:Uncharacterized protein n=1 Tax=Teichococcus aerophilus TaxID=1224513 RepID=A0ABR7RLE3_9PROT|nr:hypothetical protein [Pseudoroseomonas aerophila]MBC9207129.1 hypothetical protein [Pseudoroseomonas aerophila]
MSLATYTLKMAAIAAPAAALVAFGAEPMPAGWLDGIVTPGGTVGHAAVVIGFWAAGVASIMVSAVVAAGLARDAWRLRQELRQARTTSAH